MKNIDLQLFSLSLSTWDIYIYYTNSNKTIYDVRLFTQILTYMY